MANFDKEKKIAIDMLSVWGQHPESVLIRVPFGASAEALRAEMQTLLPGKSPHVLEIAEAANASLGTTHTVEMTLPDMVEYFDAVRKREENKPASPDISAARVDTRATPIFNKMLDDALGKADAATVRLPVHDPEIFRAGVSNVPLAAATPIDQGAVNVAVSRRHEAAEKMSSLLTTVKTQVNPETGVTTTPQCTITFDPETNVPMGMGPHYTMSADNFSTLHQLAEMAKTEAKKMDRTVFFEPPTDVSRRAMITMAGLQAMVEERAEKLNPNPAGSSISGMDGSNVTCVDFKTGKVTGRGWPGGSGGSGGEQS
jgi:hypothetical protein